MVAPVFNFRNVKTRLTNTIMNNVYGVNIYDSANPDSTLPPGVLTSDVSSMILTIQCANITGLSSLPSPANTESIVYVSVQIYNQISSISTFLVQNYPVVSANAFDPLSGNLVLTAGDTIQVQSSIANGIDVIVTLMEIANAPPV